MLSPTTSMSTLSNRTAMSPSGQLQVSHLAARTSNCSRVMGHSAKPSSERSVAVTAMNTMASSSSAMTSMRPARPSQLQSLPRTP